MNKKHIGWWSAGVTSMVACRFLVERHGPENVRIIYFKIGTAHPDNVRVKAQCEEWYGVPIEEVSSDKYEDQFDVIESTRYINGPGGARCTTELKKSLRLKLQKEIDYASQTFGFEYNNKEINRALRFQDQYPEALAEFPLIERGMDKAACLYYLERNGIKRPKMYELGYPNNNCIGCVKGGKGYWNKIRKDFPETFERMIECETDLGRSCINGTFLEDLDPNAGIESKIIMPDCGSFCDIKFTEVPHKLLNDIKNVPFIVKNPKPWLTVGNESVQLDRSIIQYLGKPISTLEGIALYENNIMLTSDPL